MLVDLVAGGIVSADSPKRLHLASSLRDDRTPEPVTGSYPMRATDARARVERRSGSGEMTVGVR